MHGEVKAPPMGLKPKYIHDEERFTDVKGALIRYIDAGLMMDPEWIKEYETLRVAVIVSKRPLGSTLTEKLCGNPIEKD